MVTGLEGQEGAPELLPALQAPGAALNCSTGRQLKPPGWDREEEEKRNTNKPEPDPSKCESSQEPYRSQESLPGDKTRGITNGVQKQQSREEPEQDAFFAKED